MRWWVIERADRYHLQGLGVWAKRPKLSGGGGSSVLGVPVETGGGGDGGGRVGVGNEVVVVVGTANRYCMQGLVVWAKNLKPSGGSSVSCVPVETDGGGGGGGTLGVEKD